MRFVALDLETTGLSPQTDTIIEVAAIRFQIEQIGDIFSITHAEEHTQLIHPERLLSKEITMITGITPEMLLGKPNFASVSDKIRDFIGDAVIVGHNVLFDIAMFASHGINLSQNIVIDTFELSELFSQDVESLNLGFLANRYGLIDPTEEEHRALTDTKISIRLLLRYLAIVRQIKGKKKQIWNTLILCDTSRTLVTLSEICHLQSDIQPNTCELFLDLLANQDTKTPTIKDTAEKQEISKSETSCTITDGVSEIILLETHGDPSEELIIIKDTFKTNTHIALVTPGYKTAIWMSGFLSQNSIENMISVSPSKWCSVKYMRELLTNAEPYSRKKLILILKIAFWLTDTETGLLDEMKFYGEERTMLEIFRCRKNESNIWRQQYEAKIRNIPVVIYDAYTFEKKDTQRYTIIKDIALLEDITRRSNSHEISFDNFYKAIEILPSDMGSLDAKIHMADMVSMIRGIYESIPDRPTGPLISPPGPFGETYFFTQAMLWDNGNKWLIHATRTLAIYWKDWKNTQLKDTEHISREVEINKEYIERTIGLLVNYHIKYDTNYNITLNINDEKTKIMLLPRSVKKFMKNSLSGSLCYGVNISFPETRSFLIREYGIDKSMFSILETQPKPKNSHLNYTEYHAGIVKTGTVILTTSQKHARDIGQVLRKIHGKNIEVLIQGLSGGKGKMLSLFKNNIDTTILIGIIDTWRDEYDLWKNARNIIIAKLPFDPPTDPYFLARTMGMGNNFSDYSQPIVTIRLNTLLDRILASGYSGGIVSTDPRLITTEWGKKITSELL